MDSEGDHMKLTIATMLVAAGLGAQTLKLPVNIENLSRIATETVDVTVDASMLRFAERVLTDRDADQARPSGSSAAEFDQGADLSSSTATGRIRKRT
jgi:hypothetical protein